MPNSPSPIHIMITLDFPPEHGGIQRLIDALVKHRYGPHDLVLVGCAPEHRKAPSDNGYGCRIIRRTNALARVNKKWSLLSLAPRFVGLVIRLRRSELTIECANLYAGLLPWALSRLFPLRYTLYAHGTELLTLTRPQNVRALLLRSVVRRASALIANSQATARLLQNIAPLVKRSINNPRIALTPELSRFVPRDPVIHRSAMLLCVGRLVAHKGHSLLIDAAHKLAQNNQLRVVVVGEGPLYDSLAAQVDRLKLSNTVTLLRSVTDTQLDELYKTADLFVMPSFETTDGMEGFGIALLEAMAHSVPVIAGRSGGIPEVLDNGNCGILVAPNDSTALAQGIEKLLREPHTAQEFARKAHERLLSCYTWTH